ncbi:hypothetical protein SL053_002422 [Flavobacterium psychrophilum]|nr:hypothetical protein [Flavobacterium psychrophilum]
MKYLVIILSLIAFSNCKDNNSNVTKNLQTEKNIGKNDLSKTIDTTINSIKTEFIKGEILGDKKKFIIKNYYSAMNREIERPHMADSFMSNIDTLFTINEYRSIVIGKISIKSYLIKIKFEDAIYFSILLLNENKDYPYDCLLIYENLKSESNYNCFSKIKNNIITVNRLDSYKKNSEKYMFNENQFLNYFDNSEIDIPEWGDKDVIYTKDGLDSSYVYKYSTKGKIKNHLKDGIWEERRFILEYDRSVWLDGKYINGVKDGEWNYSPEGPVDKIELYEKGKLIKITKR